eukprot:gene36768-44601_t
MTPTDILNLKDVMCEVLSQWVHLKGLVLFISALPKVKSLSTHSVLKLISVRQPFGRLPSKWRHHATDVLDWMVTVKFHNTVDNFQFSAELWNHLSYELRFEPILEHLISLTLGNLSISGMEFDVSSLSVCKQLQYLELVCLNLYTLDPELSSLNINLDEKAVEKTIAQCCDRDEITNLCPKLLTLVLKHCRVTTTPSLGLLQTCKQLQTIHVSYCNFSDINDSPDINSSAFFRKITSFESSNQLDSVHFQQSTALQSLLVNNYSDPDSLTDLLYRSRDISKLSLIKSTVVHSGTSTKEFLPRLESLYLQSMDVTAPLLLGFAHCQHLTSLQYMYCDSYVSYHDVPPADRPAYCALFSRLLEFTCTADLETILPTHLPEALGGLQVVQLGESHWGGRGDEVSDSIVAFLCRCPALRRLTFYSAPLQIHKVMRVLADKCPVLDTLVLNNCNRRAELRCSSRNTASSSFVPSASLPSHSSVRHLWLNVSRFSDEDLDILLSTVGASVEALRLSRCTRLSPWVFGRVLSGRLPRLRSLVIDHLEEDKHFTTEHAQAMETHFKGLKHMEINVIAPKQASE